MFRLQSPADSRQPSIQQRPAIRRRQFFEPDPLHPRERLAQDAGVRPLSEGYDDARPLRQPGGQPPDQRPRETRHLIDTVDEQERRIAHGALGKNLPEAADGHAVGRRRRGGLSGLDQQLAKQPVHQHPWIAVTTLCGKAPEDAVSPADPLDPEAGHERRLSGAGTPLDENRNTGSRFDGVVQPLELAPALGERVSPLPGKCELNLGRREPAASSGVFLDRGADLGRQPVMHRLCERRLIGGCRQLRVHSRLPIDRRVEHVRIGNDVPDVLP